MALISHSQGIVTDEEVIFLLEENISRNPEFLYDAHNCHGKRKSLTARANLSRQKQTHSRQKQFHPAEYTCLVWFVYFYLNRCPSMNSSNTSIKAEETDLRYKNIALSLFAFAVSKFALP